MRLVDKVVKNSSSKQRWKDVKVLIIDEISMLSSDLFELLDLIARHVRESDLPFGSIQVVIVGDFLQLPPVTKNSGGSKGDRKFCFQSPVWDALGLNCQNGRRFLETVVRQENLEFVRNLNDVRIGIATPNFMRMLNSCLVKNKPMPTNGIIPTKVYSINKQVDEENLQRLAELPGEIVTVEATDMWLTKPTQSSSTTAIRNGIENVIPEKINLKIGAQVMLLRNRCKSNYASGGKISSVGLVNGSRGKIIDFVESVVQEGMLVPLVQFDNGLVTTIGTVSFSFKGPNGDGELVRSQVPLKLAW